MGKGTDVEIVANFIYSLFEYNYKKYSKIIRKGINYIISEQKEAGFWESRWYYGNYYGIYVCLRLLNCFPNDYEEIKQKALNFIITHTDCDCGTSYFQILNFVLQNF